MANPIHCCRGMVFRSPYSAFKSPREAIACAVTVVPTLSADHPAFSASMNFPMASATFRCRKA